MAAALLSDEELLCRSRAGELPAFGEIVRRYEGLLRGLAYSACGDRMHSEDIAQVAFVTAWRRLSELRDDRRLRPWLCAITRSIARLAQRHASRRPEGHAVPLDELPESHSAASTPDQGLALREEENLVWEVLRRLPPDWREVLVLYYQEEHSVATIAAELGLSQPAVRQRLVRGRAMLRDRLAHLVDFSLKRGPRPSGAVAAATLAAISAEASAASAITVTSTHFAVMTKLHALAAGVVLTALVSTPFFLHQRHTIAGLRERILSRDASQNWKPAAGHESEPSGIAQSVRSGLPGSLDDLRLLLPDRPSRQHRAALWGQAERLPIADLRRLLLEALNTASPDWRDKEIAALLLDRLGQLDPAATLALLDSLTDAQLFASLDDLAGLDRIAAHDPVGAAQLLGRLPMNSAAAPKFVRLAEAWVGIDPQSALGWAEALDFELIRTETLAALYRKWAEQDPTAALASLDRVQDASFRRKVFEEMAWQIFTRDPKGAEAWARGRQGEDHGSALGLLGARVAESDPSLAAQYLQESIDTGYRRLAWPSGEIGYAQAQRDPVAAGRWAMGLPEGDVQEHAVSGVVRAWTAKDPAAASEWVATLPPGVTRNSATYHLVEGILGSDPAAAFRWASSLEGDAEKRLYLLQRSTDFWTRSSPDGARAAIEELPLSAGERDSLLRRLAY